VTSVGSRAFSLLQSGLCDATGWPDLPVIVFIDQVGGPLGDRSDGCVAVGGRHRWYGAGIHDAQAGHSVHA
jgi:hypothetical protein